MDIDANAMESGNGEAAPTGGSRRHRSHIFPGRPQRVYVRFTAEEYAELVAAAARLGLTPSGYVAEAAVMATRGASATGHEDLTLITRTELTHLQRDMFAARTAVNRIADSLYQAAATMTAAPGSMDSLDREIARCVQCVENLDAVASDIHGRLRRSTPPRASSPKVRR